MKQSTQPSSGDEIFVAIVVHGITNSPVVYLPSPSPGIKSRNSESKPVPSSVSVSESPGHLPRKDGEDSVCLIMMVPKENRDVRCILVESVGQWDARWG